MLLTTCVCTVQHTCKNNIYCNSTGYSNKLFEFYSWFWSWINVKSKHKTVIIKRIKMFACRSTPDTCDNPGCDDDPILCPGRQGDYIYNRYTWLRLLIAKYLLLYSKFVRRDHRMFLIWLKSFVSHFSPWIICVD